MGTPDFAVASLRALVEDKWPIVAVITAPDKKRGRGQTVVPSPVKQYALEQKIDVLQPTNLKDPAFLDQLQAYKANLHIVVAFRMLPRVVWDMPELGTFNLHASLLPNYRGAAPINWAIINGEKETGVTTFFLKHEIDTGSIIMQEKEPIGPQDTVGDLYQRLMDKGGQLVVKTVKAIANGTAEPKAQPDIADLKQAPKIFKETCEIDWHKTSQTVHDFIRGLNPYPAAWTLINGNSWKIFAVKKISLKEKGQAGTILTDHKEKLVVKTGDGWLAITELQMPGKKRMQIQDLLRGNPLNELKTLKS